MKITFFGTTTLLFDDGRDQVFFDAHMTRPSLFKYICGSDVTNTGLVDEMLALHHVDRLRALFISHTHHDHVMDRHLSRTGPAPPFTAAAPPLTWPGAVMCRKGS